MKKSIIFTVAVCLSVFLTPEVTRAKSVAINDENFPEYYFQIYVKNHFDKNKDGKLSEKERNAVTELDVGEGSEFRADLEYPAVCELMGIEHFPKLKKLYCTGNGLTELDVSKNRELRELFCDNGRIKKLDLSKNKKLKKLFCSDNKIKKLNLSNNKKLEILFCDNNKISKIDVSKNVRLQELAISENKIKKINVKKLKKLRCFYCDENQIKGLDITKNTKLLELDCNSNKLQKLNVKKNVSLDYLRCENNKIKTLDLSKNKLLQELICNRNQMITGNLKIAYTQLKISEFTSFSDQSCTIKRKKIGDYYYIPLPGLNATNEIRNLSAGIITEKGIRLPEGECPSTITYEYNMFTDGEELTKVTIQVKK